MCNDPPVEAKAPSNAKGAGDLAAGDPRVNATTARGEQYSKVLHGFACGDDGRPDGSGSSSTGSGGPSFTDCASCPVGVPDTCPAGQVCAVATPGLGGRCILACSDDEPEPCVYDGIVTGTCKVFSNEETRGCNNPDNGPVCPPSK